MRAIIIFSLSILISNISNANEPLSPVTISLSDDAYYVCNKKSDTKLYKVPGIKFSYNEIVDLSTGDILKKENLSLVEKPLGIFPNWDKVSIGGSFGVNGWIDVKDFCYLK